LAIYFHPSRAPRVKEKQEPHIILVQIRGSLLLTIPFSNRLLVCSGNAQSSTVSTDNMAEFTVREGITLSDLKMPNRIIGRPPFEAGPTAGREVDMETMARDWEPDTAKPSKRKLLELGLEDVAEDLWPE
jgi:hypothetical protein